MKSNNALMHLSLYKQGTVWLFDDKANNITAEPFVAGMSEIITHHAGKKKKCSAIFGSKHFPGSNVLHLKSKESGGGWYTDAITEMEGWLCPVVTVYFNEVPKLIYYSIK